MNNMSLPRDERKVDIDPDDHDPFAWDDPCVVVQPVTATAVYIDEHDNVVIRQQGAWNDDGDDLIVLPRHEAEKVAAAIFDATVALWPSNRQRQGETKAAPTAPAYVSGKEVVERRDPTAAERQRRRRARMRDTARDSRDSERDTDRDIMADDDPTLRPEEAAE